MMNLIVTCARHLEEETEEELRDILDELGDSEIEVSISDMSGILTAQTKLEPIKVVKKMKEIVPEFISNNSTYEKLDFIETLCAPSCLSILKKFSPDYLKVASRDLTNLPLLAALAETQIPIIVSTGMAGDRELDDAIEVITSYHSNLSILHCVSQYPTEPKNVPFMTS